MTLTTAAVLFMLSQSQTQKAQPAQRISFEPDEISAERKQPDLEQIDSRPPTTFSNLIKIRENFADKILNSAKQM